MVTSTVPESAEDRFARLILDQVVPVVSRIVRSKVRGPAAEDVQNDILAGLIAHLRSNGAENEIRDLPAYAAIAAYRGCSEHFRSAYPQRFRLRQRLRYLLTKDPVFELWQCEEGDWMCGLRKVVSAARDKSWASSQETARHLRAVLKEAGEPMTLDRVVEQVGHRMGILDSHGCDAADVASGSQGVETQLVNRDWLRVLWGEVTELPLPQRLALLLNLRDDQGGPALALLPLIGVATIRQIADTLSMTAERLAEIWNDLPLEDSSIASLLSVQRQNVINLRKSARERLTRRISRCLGNLNR